MYLVIRSGVLGKQNLIIGPFFDACQRSLWRSDFFEELCAENAQFQDGERFIDALVWNAEEDSTIDTTDADNASARDVVERIAGLRK